MTCTNKGNAWLNVSHQNNETRVFAKVKQLLPLVRHPPCYSYIQSIRGHHYTQQTQICLFIFCSSSIYAFWLPLWYFQTYSICQGLFDLPIIISYIGFRHVIRAHITCLFLYFLSRRRCKYTTQTGYMSLFTCLKPI